LLDEDDYEMVFPDKYHSEEMLQTLQIVQETKSSDGKLQRIYSNGKKEVIFANGVKREVWPDSYQIVWFANKDIKQTFNDGKTVYYFAEAKTTQTTFADGL